MLPTAMQPEEEGGEACWVAEMPSFRTIYDGREKVQLVLGDQVVERRVGEGVNGGCGELDFAFGYVTCDSLHELEPAADDDGAFPAYPPIFGHSAFRIPPVKQYPDVLADGGGGGDSRYMLKPPDWDGDGDDNGAAASRAVAAEAGKRHIGLSDLPGPVARDGEHGRPSFRSSPVGVSPDELEYSPSFSYPPCFTGAASKKRTGLFNLLGGRGHGAGKQIFCGIGHSKGKKDGKKSGGLAPVAAAAGKDKKGGGRAGVNVAAEMDMSAAYSFYYAKWGEAEGFRRRSFLPYRMPLLGIFVPGNGAAAARRFSPS